MMRVGRSVAALGALRLLSRGRGRKLGAAALLWSLAPRKVRMYAAAGVGVTLIVVIGLIVGVVLLVLETT